MAKITNVSSVSFSRMQCDCDEINARLDELEASQCDCKAIDERLTTIENDITEIRTEITNATNEIWNTINRIEQFVFLSDVTIYSAANPFYGATISTINAGHTYNFWGSGALTSSVTLTNNTIYYLARSGQPTTTPPALPNRIPVLEWYQGSSTIGTMFIEGPPTIISPGPPPVTTPGPVIATVPLRFDETGIWFRTDYNIGTIAVGSVFKFTQALILVDTTS
ncbi:MAG: hypothetical protein FWE16_01475 [Firmicutes bacterium]|nr:hypothetical protein [Bacillota bacterium]